MLTDWNINSFVAEYFLASALALLSARVNAALATALSPPSERTWNAEGLATFLKLPIEKIAKDYDLHEEMPYLIEDGITEIDYNYSFS